MSKGKPYDAAVRTLLGTNPQDWLRFLNLPDVATVETLDTDLSFVTTSADGLLRVGDTEPFGLHFEFEAGHHGSETPGRLCAYNLWAFDRYKLPFWSVLVLLKPEADSPRITGTWEQRLPGATRTLVHSFTYQVVRVWKIAPDVLLSTGFGVFPLAPIADVADADLPALIERMTQLVDTAINDNRLTDNAANDLWAATYVLFGARHDRALARALMGRIHRMRESTTFQAIIEEGREEGRVDMMQENIIEFGIKRFGQLSASTEARILATRSLPALKALRDRFDAVETWDELLAGTAQE